MKNEKQAHTLEYSYQRAKRCGAKTRQGTPCKSPAVHGKKRCRMHGGAKGSGAQVNNKNALKHGFYIAEERNKLKVLSDFVRKFRNKLMDIS